MFRDDSEVMWFCATPCLRNASRCLLELELGGNPTHPGRFKPWGTHWAPRWKHRRGHVVSFVQWIRLVCYRSLLSEDIWYVRRLHLKGRMYLEFSNMNLIWNIENILRLNQFQIECRIGLKHTSLLHKMAYRIPLICSLGCSPAVCGKLFLIGASKTRGLAVGNCRILMNKELRTWWSTCASLEAASVAAFGFWLRMSEYSWFWVPKTAEGS